MNGATSTEIASTAISASRMPGSPRATAKPSRIPCHRGGGDRRFCVLGGSRLSAQNTAVYESALTANAHAGPATVKTMVANAGPSTRPTLYCAELRLNALGSDAGGTSSEISATNPGKDNVEAQPPRKANSAIQPTVRCPVNAR